ncbi:hypothetical protein K443DRAFT_339796 [Laccaria amethystina LaAM-08-1]|uniref:Uncharacterized protein n=1 Tax=Laccaria amethystina LaAM-08-1 TaxID=1095629 RepID=A0A0C9XBE4_9AGAR|nr:hypothetical protein K443DRAFT_339796 [Laccaria amethystina LaAM-08-1]
MDGSTIRPISRTNCISLRASRTTSSVAGPILDPRGEAIKLSILKRNGFPSASPVDDGVPTFASLPHPFRNSPPTLHLIQAIPSRSVATHPFVLRGQVHEQKKQRAKVTQHHPSLGSPSSAQPLPVTNSSSHAISSPSSPPSPLPPTSTPMSHIRCHVGPVQGLALQQDVFNTTNLQ